MFRTMKGPAMLLLPLLGMQACGKAEQEAPEASIETGLERSVSDVRAAEAAAAGPISAAPSAADLTDRGSDAQSGT